MGGAGARGEIEITYTIESPSEEITLRDTGGNDLGLDGDTVNLGTLPNNGDFTELPFRLYNTGGDGDITINQPGTPGGNAAYPLVPDVGSDVIAEDAYSGFSLAFDTTTNGTGFSGTFSISHDGTQTPFNVTFTYDVSGGVASISFLDSVGYVLGVTGGSHYVGAQAEGTAFTARFRIYNDGNASLTLDFDTEASTGCTVLSHPSGGQIVVTPGHYEEIELSFPTDVVGVNLASSYNVEHNGPGGIFEFNFTHTVTASPTGSVTSRSRLFRDPREFRNPRV